MLRTNSTSLHSHTYLLLSHDRVRRRIFCFHLTTTDALTDICQSYFESFFPGQQQQQQLQKQQMKKKQSLHYLWLIGKDNNRFAFDVSKEMIKMKLSDAASSSSLVITKEKFFCRFFDDPKWNEVPKYDARGLNCLLRTWNSKRFILSCRCLFLQNVTWAQFCTFFRLKALAPMSLA